jgi:small subunit ribosomal protein S4
MARYVGPVCKLCRREGMKLYLKGERCYTEKCATRAAPTRRVSTARAASS